MNNLRLDRKAAIYDRLTNSNICADTGYPVCRRRILQNIVSDITILLKMNALNDAQNKCDAYQTKM